MNNKQYKRRLILPGLLILAMVAVFNWEKITQLSAVLTLFDEDRIVQNFSNMENIFHSKPIRKAGETFKYNYDHKPLPEKFVYRDKLTSVEEFLKRRATTALVVVKDDKITFEQYYLGTRETDKRISWSMAKSFVSVLLGIQVDAGKVDIDKPVSFYLADMADSGYGNVKIKQVLQMSSGVKWNEDYLAFNSDINKMGRLLAIGGSLDEMTRAVESEGPSGQRFHYVSMDTHVLGMIVRKVTGKSLVELLQNEFWSKMGMEADAAWITDSESAAFALGGLNMISRDYARFGRLLLRNGDWQGNQIVSADWIRKATTAGADYLKPGKNKLGYGYQIWLPQDAQSGEFFCVGVYGQYIYVNQEENVVIVKNSADRNFMEKYDSKQETIAFFREVVASLSTGQLSEVIKNNEDVTNQISSN